MGLEVMQRCRTPPVLAPATCGPGRSVGLDSSGWGLEDRSSTVHVDQFPASKLEQCAAEAVRLKHDTRSP